MEQNSFLGRGINDYLYAKESMKDEKTTPLFEQLRK